MEKQDVKNLIKVWYNNKAKWTFDPVFRFVCLWICFNAWLDCRSDENTDKEMIVWLIKKFHENKSCDLIHQYEMAKKTDPFVNSLKGLVLESQKEPIKSERGAWRSIRIHNEHDFENILKAIYKVRCNLFHGQKNADKPRDKKLIQLCSSILLKWMGNLVASWEKEDV